MVLLRVPGRQPILTQLGSPLQVPERVVRKSCGWCTSSLPVRWGRSGLLICQSESKANRCLADSPQKSPSILSHQGRAAMMFP
jgi:hypothetical protein